MPQRLLPLPARAANRVNAAKIPTLAMCVTSRYGEIIFIELTVGEYRARCHLLQDLPLAASKSIEPRAEYTNRVRDAIIDRLLDDSMCLNRLQESMKRDFLLDLSDGFLYDCLDWKVRQTRNAWLSVNGPSSNFSGTLCIDELHLGHRTLLLATDPLGDFPVAFALVSANDKEHMRALPE